MGLFKIILLEAIINSLIYFWEEANFQNEVKINLI